MLCGECPDGWARDDYPELCSRCPDDPVSAVTAAPLQHKRQIVVATALRGTLVRTTSCYSSPPLSACRHLLAHRMSNSDGSSQRRLHQDGPELRSSGDGGNGGCQGRNQAAHEHDPCLGARFVMRDAFVLVDSLSTAAARCWDPVAGSMCLARICSQDRQGAALLEAFQFCPALRVLLALPNGVCHLKLLSI